MSTSEIKVTDINGIVFVVFILIVIIMVIVSAVSSIFNPTESKAPVLPGETREESERCKIVQYMSRSSDYTREDVTSVTTNLKDVRSILNSIWFVLILLVILYLGESRLYSWLKATRVF